MINLCILDKPNRSWMQSNYSTVNFDKLVFDPDLEQKVKQIYYDCVKVGLYCPTVKILSDVVTMKYDYDDYYVKFIIDFKDTHFTFGILGKEPKEGKLTDAKQLNTLSKFVYHKLNKLNSNLTQAQINRI